MVFTFENILSKLSEVRTNYNLILQVLKVSTITLIRDVIYINPSGVNENNRRGK